MTAARLHDGSIIEVTARGDGPAVLLPVRTAPIEGAAADRMRAWGVEPNAGADLAAALPDHRVVSADYEGHRAAHPAPQTLTADALSSDLLAIADAAGVARFAYYGYSWLALAGLQLAIRTDRLTGLAMGGFPPLGGPYAAMLAVTRAAHRQSLHNVGKSPTDPAPGDWDSAEVTAPPEQTGQYLTLYESLQDFDETEVRLNIPRFAFAGADDVIQYGAKWDHARVDIGPALASHREELERQGWTVEVLENKDHLTAMHADVVRQWLRDRR
jgi:pimeloyl-ACP methyl ester carboxylesterase